MINLDDNQGSTGLLPRLPGTGPGWPNLGQDEPLNVQQEYMAQRRALESDKLSKLYLDEKEFARMANQSEIREGRRLSLLGDDLPKVALNAAYLSHRLGRKVTASEYELARDGFAAANFGQEAVTDGQFFDLVKGEYDVRRQKTEALDELRLRMAAQSLEDGVAGADTPAVDTWKAWKEKHRELVGDEDDLPYLAAAVAERNEFKQVVDKYKHLAGPGLDLLKKFTAGEASGEELSDFAKTLAGVPREEQDMVIDLIALGADGGQIDRGALKEFATSLGQTFSRGFNFIPQSVLQQKEVGVTAMLEAVESGTKVWVLPDGDLSRAVVSNTEPDTGYEIKSGWREATAEERQKMIDGGNESMSVFRLERQLRAVADNNVDPIKRIYKGGVMGAIEGGVLGVAGSLPLLTATAVNPFAGMMAYQAMEFDRMRFENPDMSVRAAYGISLVEGAWQAAIDRLQLRTLQGALPVTGRLLGKIKSTGLRRTVGFAASGAEQFGQELTQDIGTLAIDAIASSLREDMKDKDFTFELGEYWKQAPEVLVASLIFGMWGGGAITARELRGTPAEWDEAARIVGIGEDGRKRMRAATTPEELDAVVERELKAVTPESQAAGALYAKAKRQAAEASQADPNEPTLEVVKDEEGNSLYRITTPDGETLIETRDAQAAQAAFLDYRTTSETNEVQALKDVISYWQNRDPELSIEQAPAVLVKEELDRLEGVGDATGIERLRQRLVAADINPDGDLTGVQIFGSTTVQEVGENVYRGTILVRQGAAPETVLEEVNHAFVRRALMRGDVTLDTLSGWLEQTATATGLDIKRGNEVEVIESIAQVGMDLFNGRLDQAQLPQSLVDYLRRLMRVVKEIYVRAVKITEAFDKGEIDGNFEQFLMQSMGMDPQQQIDINSTTTAARLSTGAPEDQRGPDGLTDTERFALEQELLADMEAEAAEAAGAGGTDILDAVREAGGLPSMTSSKVKQYAGELKNIREAQKPGNAVGVKGAFNLFRKNAPDMDGLIKDLQDMGFRDITTPSELFEVIDRRLRTGRKIYGYERGGALADYSVGRVAEIKKAVIAVHAEAVTQSPGFLRDVTDAARKSGGRAVEEYFAKAVKKLNTAVGKVDRSPKVPSDLLRATIEVPAGGPSAARSAARKIIEAMQAKGYEIYAPDGQADITDRHQDTAAGYKDIALKFVKDGRQLDPVVKEILVLQPAMFRAKKPLHRAYKRYRAAVKQIGEERSPDKIAMLEKVLIKASAEIQKLGRAAYSEDAGNLAAQELNADQSSEDISSTSSGRSGGAGNLANTAARMDSTSRALSFVSSLTMQGKVNMPGREGQALEDFSIGRQSFKDWFGDWENDLANASKVVDANGRPLVVYHGTRRPDRVGNRFRKSRATSGPMAFFTATADIASSYAEGKVDTSLEMPDDYAGWFKFKGKGMRSSVALDRAWFQLSQAERDTINQRIYTVGYQNAEEASGPIVADSSSIMGRDSIDYELRQARGNALRALVEIWLNSGSLFNDEQMFMQVLEAAGLDMTRVTYDSPHAVKSAVYPVYLSIKNPLDTGNIPPGVLEALKQASKRKRAKRSAGGNADAWDKNTISGKDWIDTLTRDVGNGWSHAWTRIPDWVTDTLEQLGYDGVMDTGGKLGGPKHQVWIPFNESQVKSATGNRGTFDPTDPRIDFSIGRPRVDRALASAMNRKPGERLAMYERAKEMFDRVAARRGESTGPDGYARTLQSLWELDAILKVLPAEVRGKVGGFTRIAELEPVDLYRGDELLTESNSPAGARIAAWMQEGLNIGEAGKKTELPEGYSIRRNTDPARATKATDDFLVKRLATVGKQLDRYLANEYRIAIERTLEAAKPKRTESGVRKSNLGPQAQAFADKVREAALLDNDQTAQRLVAIEAELVKPETADARRIELVEEWGILNTFGDLDGRNAETLAQGLAELRETLKAGRMAWRTKEEERIAGQRMMIQSIINGLGEATKSKRFADKGKIEQLAEMISVAGLDHGNFEQFLRAVIPDEAIVTRWSDLMRKADTGAQDMELAMRQELVDAIKVAAKAAGMGKNAAMAMLKRPSQLKVRAIEGYEERPAKISIELARKIVNGELAPRTRAENTEAVKELLEKGEVIMDAASLPPLTKDQVNELRETLAALPADTRKKSVSIRYVLSEGRAELVPMSPAQAIQLELSWDQPDVQEKMRREGWTDESIEDIRAITSEPVAAATLAFLRDFYARNYAMVNPVYARMFGMNMPQAKFYAPSRFLSAGKQNEVGLDGTPQMTGSTPGFAKARVSHSSPIDPVDALTVYQQHVVQTAHWVNFSEFAREARAVTSNLDLRESISQKYGELTLQSIDRWVEQLEQRGANKSREMRWMGDLMGAYLGGTAISSLGFNMRTVAINTDSAMRFTLVLTPRQIGSVLMSPIELAKALPRAWFSPTVQRRLKGGMDPATQFMFARRSTTPGPLSSLAWLSMQPVQIYDAAGTTLSSAMVYLANYQDAKAAGMPDAQAEQVAFDAMDAAVYRYSQPTGLGSKSNIENNAGPFGKLLTLFMSDPRLKTGVMLEAVREIGRGKNVAMNVQRIVAIEAMALVSHVIASAYRDAFSDEEDEDIWSVEGFALALLLAPFQGLFLAGAMTETALRAAMGMQMWAPPTAPFAGNLEQGVRAVKNYDQLFAPESITEGLKAWNSLLRGLSVSTPMGAPAALLNILKPFIGLQQNLEADE